MAEEEKELLLKDICTRLPYRPFAMWHHKALNKFRDVKIMKVSTYGKNIDDYYINVLCQPEPGEDFEVSIVDIKPYLRPMSSMTEEERNEYFDLRNQELQRVAFAEVGRESAIAEISDWLNKHYFDYRGLIQMGLAVEAPEGMYND